MCTYAKCFVDLKTIFQKVLNFSHLFNTSWLISALLHLLPPCISTIFPISAIFFYLEFPPLSPLEFPPLSPFHFSATFPTLPFQQMFSPLTFLQLFPPLAFKQLFSCSQFCVHAAWTRIFATFIFFWLLLLMLLMLAKLLWQEVSTLHAWVITQPWSSFFSRFVLLSTFWRAFWATLFVFPLHFWVISWSKYYFGSEVSVPFSLTHSLVG